MKRENLCDPLLNMLHSLMSPLLKSIREMEVLVTTLRAESKANQQKYELELVVSKVW